MEITAKARFVRIGPRKLRYLRPIVVKKEAQLAMNLLEHTSQKGALILRKLIKSALANAEQKSPEQKIWYIKNLLVDEGPKMKRMRSAPMGRAVIIMKKFSHITVVLEDLPETKDIKGNKYGTKGKSNRS
ncbi:MAG: 50S ribosomal protein L22 [Candidatus Omnitrophica bacterium]|nr:50S ribosomal protein L22 [Candidatus Omnitrophota bacterium]MCM8788637.1 50S ribosomal protein L22 [Candidatus Omnitrophota bacterium]